MWGLALELAGAFASHTLGAWLAGSGGHCHCVVDPAVHRPWVDFLERQLERCSEGARLPAASAASAAPCGCWAWAVAGFVAGLGCAVCGLLALSLGSRAAEPATREEPVADAPGATTAAGPNPALANSPAGRRALRQ